MNHVYLAISELPGNERLRFGSIEGNFRVTWAYALAIYTTSNGKLQIESLREAIVLGGDANSLKVFEDFVRKGKERVAAQKESAKKAALALSSQIMSMRVAHFLRTAGLEV